MHWKKSVTKCSNISHKWLWGNDQIRIELGTSTGWYILAQITGSCVNNETSASKMVFNGYLEWFL